MWNSVSEVSLRGNQMELTSIAVTLWCNRRWARHTEVAVTSAAAARHNWNFNASSTVHLSRQHSKHTSSVGWVEAFISFQGCDSASAYVLQSKMIKLIVGLNGCFTKFNREKPSVPQTLNHIIMEFLIAAVDFTKLHAWNCERIIGTSHEAGEELPCTHALYMHTYIFDSPAHVSNLKWHCVLEISITHSKRCGWENPIPVKQLTPGRPLWSQTHRHPKHPRAKPQ